MAVFCGRGILPRWIQCPRSSQKKISRDVVIAPLLRQSKIKLLEPKLFGISEAHLEPKKAIELIQFLDGYFGGYSRVLLRI